MHIFIINYPTQSQSNNSILSNVCCAVDWLSDENYHLVWKIEQTVSRLTITWVGKTGIAAMFTGRTRINTLNAANDGLEFRGRTAANWGIK